MKRITNGMKVSFYIPKEWHEEIKKIAEKSGSSIAVQYRMAIKEYIDKHRGVI